MARNKKIVMALKEITVDKKVDLVPSEAVSPEQGVHYPTFNIETKFVPPLKDAELDQQVRMVIEGKIKAKDDYKRKDPETEVETEHSSRTVEVHRIGVSKIGKALKA